MGIIRSLSLSKSIWSMTFKMLLKYPRILLPFFITAVVQGLVLTILFYFPRPPFVSIFGPPIKAFFTTKAYSGARFLHYPDNFLILPQLFYYGQVLTMITVGVVMFGMAMGMVYQANTEGETVKIFGNLNRSVRRYLALAGIWIITFILSLLILRLPVFLIVKFMQPTPFAKILFVSLPYLGIFIAFLLEALFIYAYPAIIIERRKFFGAIKRSFSMSKKIFLTTVILIATPRILEIFVILARQKLKGLMNLTFPEITVGVLAGAIVVAFITDSLVFLTTANLFVLAKETEKEVAA